MSDCVCLTLYVYTFLCDFVHMCVFVYVPVYMTMCDCDICMDMYVHMCVFTCAQSSTWGMVLQKSLILICFFIVVVLIGLVGYCCSGKRSHGDLDISV